MLEILVSRLLPSWFTRANCGLLPVSTVIYTVSWLIAMPLAYLTDNIRVLTIFLSYSGQEREFPNILNYPFNGYRMTPVTRGSQVINTNMWVCTCPCKCELSSSAEGSAHRGDFMRCCLADGKRGNKRFTPTDIKTLPLPSTTISISTPARSLAALFLWLSVCLYLRGTSEAYMREWVLTADADATSGGAGTVTCQPLSCLRQCS